jgi:hypothetical protein
MKHIIRLHHPGGNEEDIRWGSLPSHWYVHHYHEVDQGQIFVRRGFSVRGIFFKTTIGHYYPWLEERNK